jgi:hypothetical protein
VFAADFWFVEWRGHGSPVVCCGPVLRAMSVNGFVFLCEGRRALCAAAEFVAAGGSSPLRRFVLDCLRII